MKIVHSKVAGGPESLVVEDVANPMPQPGQVVIDVKACGVNFPDALLIADKYQIRPSRPFAPGAEVAGLIEAVGKGVEGFRVGDRVIGVPGWGGMAQKVTVDATNCVPMPTEMPYEHGATFIATYGTAYHALKQRGRVRAGETVLVLGAGGGVGLATVELANAMGARVIAAVSSQEKADLAISKGADAAIIYPRILADDDSRKTLAERFKQLCGKGGADLICDNVGGDYTIASLRAIAWGGRFLVIGFPAGIPSLPLNILLLKGCDVMGVLYGAFVQRDRAASLNNIAQLLALYTAGAIAPHVSARYSFEEAGLAIAQLADRRAMGKIVVIPD